MHEEFKNEKCAACGMKFFDDADIVVCPECGTPYHRECWERIGACVHSAEHGSYEWKGENQELREHLENIESAENQKHENTNDGFEIIHVDSYDEYREIMDKKLLEQQKDFDAIDGVTAQELLKFIGKNGYYYLPVFKDIRKNNKSLKLNFAAFLMFPMHCFYRKMNLFGVVMMTLLFLTTEAKILLGHFAEQLGISDHMLMTAYIIATALSLAIDIFVLMFFNYFYFKSCIKRINAIKHHYSDENYDRILARIEAAGRPSLFYAVAFSLCSGIAIIFVFQLFNSMLGIGNTLVNALMN